MEKWKQIKVKHHYVWRYYLQNWANNNEVFWLTPTGNIAHHSPKGMCREDGFYKISTFDDIDIEYIKIWSIKSPEFLQKQHVKQINRFIQISNVLKLARALNVSDEEYYVSEKALLYNSLEDCYCEIESGAKLAIEGLAQGDISILDNEKISIGLYLYLGHQITRTKALRDRFFGLSRKNISLSKYNEKAVELMEKNWWFLGYMLGGNCGYSLYSACHEENLFLVRNISEIPFITCDSPVINVHPEIDTILKDDAPKHLDLMFPISPKYVLMITSSSMWDYLSSGADEKSVIELNSRVASNAHYSIYGNCRAVIQSNKNMVGKW